MNEFIHRFLIFFFITFLLFYCFGEFVLAQGEDCGEGSLAGATCIAPEFCEFMTYLGNCPPPQVCCLFWGGEGITNPVIGILGVQPGEETIGYLVAVFIRLAYMFGSLLVLVFFIWGAIEWLTAGGDPEGVKRAQSRMTNAFIGLVLLAGTYLVAVILGKILKINLLEIVLPKPIK